MKIIDSHCHYDCAKYNRDRANVLRDLRQSCELLVDVGVDTASNKRIVKLVNDYDFIYGILGYFPSNVLEMDEKFLVENLKNDKIVAVGEIGLDYHWNTPDPDIQEKYFRKQIEIAKDMGLPICIHSRDAEEDTMRILKDEYDERLKAVIHCYSYGIDSVKEYIDMGFYFGVGGTSTYRNNRELREAINLMPMTHILLETDAPYLSPEPVRGSRNLSSNLIYVADNIAELKGLTTQEVIDITNMNAKRFFNI